ncbi:MAG TPA: Gfo/Idh/MocA family oxidoreductase [Verrucomicrobiae bacterium]|nr:Gfo/Idh/MocA family oxidoreductase [Verrucomicrobiae bacterium]
MKTIHQISRRKFLGTASLLAGGAPFILPSLVRGADAASGERLNMGFIGMGTQSRSLLDNFLWQETRVVAVCDVDTTRRNAAKQKVDKFYKNDQCATYDDFRDLVARKDIHAVCIATPDHWHAITTLAALRSGKDVYCEKPLTHNIHEAIAVMKSVKKHNRVLQTGSMQRSMAEFRVACELVRNGVIGQIERVECSYGDPGRPCDLKEEEMEPGLDWNMWCGPGPFRGYSPVLSPRGIFQGFPAWRDYKEYGSGGVGDWGAHHLDIAQWGLGMDDSGPVECIPPADPNAKRGAKLVYANGIVVEQKDGFGVIFFGTNGEVRVNRGRFVLIVNGKTIADFSDESKKNHGAGKDSDTTCAAEVHKAEKLYLADAPIRLYKSKQHISDFMQCVKSRKKPVANEQIGARTAICCHLVNQSYYHHAHLRWDPAKFKFTHGTGDAKWLTRDYRAPWSV